MRLRLKLTVMTGVLALLLSATVAQAGAHSFARDWHHGFFGQNAIVTGTITSVGSGSFGASAYVLTPGAGGSSTTPTTTPVTITEGANTKIVVLGQSGLTVGDTFYATYKDESSATPIATLVGGTPSKIFAFVAPTPEVEVSGVITAAPTTGDPDQFTATASVVEPPHGGSAWTPPPVGGPIRPVGGPVSAGGAWGGGYSYGGQVGGSYGFAGAPAVRPHSSRSHCATSTTAGTAGTVITVDSGTKLDINGNTTTATVGELAVGQKFTATFDGTPTETLAAIVANPALSIVATTPKALYAFVGTVTATNTTSTPETVSVAVTQSLPTGLFTGTDTFDVGPGTFVFGGSSSSLFGSLSNVTVGDVVAGGLVSTGGQAASAVEADPLQVLVDFPASSSSSSASSAAVRHLRAADFKKALRLLGKDSKKSGKKHHKKR
jgi:hypothetical protein